MDLVDTLNHQHRLLTKLAAEVASAIQRNEPSEVKTGTVRFFDALAAHLQLEESQFYPRLMELAKHDLAHGRTIELFSENMKRIGDGFQPFIRRHVGKEPIDLKAFSQEWETVLEVLRQRMNNEESTLHPLYRTLQPRAQTP